MACRGAPILVLALIFFVSSPVDAGQITVDPTVFTFKFTQSITGFTVWTAPATRRIRTTDTTPPSNTASTLPISAAREEFESFQVIIAPTSIGSMTVTMSPFPNLGPTAWIDIGHATFSATSPWGQGTAYQVTDYTTPIAQGGTVPLSSSQPTVLWITIYVPNAGTTAASTTVTSNLVLTPSGSGAVTIPVALYVFNFFLDKTPHYDTMMFSQPVRCPSGNVGCSSVAELDPWKQVYLEHRMSSNSVAWPTGLNWQVAWDCATHTINENTNSACEYANGCLVRRYALGLGGTWNGQTYADWFPQGFSSFEALSTDGGMPGSFCGQSCNDPTGNNAYCQASYMAEWTQYLTALQNYMISKGLNSKSYYYTQNEPQNWNDYNVAAFLCQTSKNAAPNLRIAISKGARPEIYANPTYNCPGYDIWMAHLSNYKVPYIWDRQEQHGETSWIYTLDTDNNCELPAGAPAPVCGPAFTPAISQTGNNAAEDPVSTNDGPHYRVIPWVSWTNRITGWGYYHDDIFWDQTWAAVPAPSRPRIASALLREGLEDYEYMYRANGNAQPTVYTVLPVDATALSLGFCFYSWNTDPTSFHALRHELGRKIEGTRADFPYITQPKVFPWGAYYISFQDPSVNPNPFSYQGLTWMPIGWGAYDVSKGYGWCSQYDGLPNVIQPSTGGILSYSGTGSGVPITDTVITDNYNHPDDFYFSIQAGTYTVTVAVGWPGGCRGGDTEYIAVNGIVVRAANCSSSPCTCQDVREYSAQIVVKGNNLLVMTVGSSWDCCNAYTILAYMKIVPVGPSPPPLTTAPPAPPPTTLPPPPTTTPPPPPTTTLPPPPTTTPPPPPTTTPPPPTTTPAPPTTAPAPPPPTTQPPPPTTVPTTTAPGPTTSTPAPTTVLTTAPPSPSSTAPLSSMPSTTAPTSSAPVTTTPGSSVPSSSSPVSSNPVTTAPGATIPASGSPTTTPPVSTGSTQTPSPSSTLPGTTTPGASTAPSSSTAPPGGSTVPPDTTLLSPLPPPTPAPTGSSAPADTTPAPSLCQVQVATNSCRDVTTIFDLVASSLGIAASRISLVSYTPCPQAASAPVLIFVIDGGNCAMANAALSVVQSAARSGTDGISGGSVVAVGTPQPGSGGGSSFPTWAVIVVVVGALLLAVVLIALVVYLVLRNSTPSPKSSRTALLRGQWATEDLYRADQPYSPFQDQGSVPQL